MKKLLILICAGMMIFGCSQPVEDQNLTGPNFVAAGAGYITIETFDAPAPDGIEHLMVHVLEVSAHHAEQGWILLSEPDSVYDYLELVNGVTAVLTDSVKLPSGEYDQLRLLLGDNNQIVIEGESFPLTVPSGLQTGIKLNLGFAIDDSELIEICIDFDLSKAVHTADSKYMLKPTFRAFKKAISGTVSGIVTDSLGVPVVGATIDASGISYSTSTLSDSSGHYMFILPAGSYDLSAAFQDFYSDTSYIGLVVNPSDVLSGYDFVMTPPDSLLDVINFIYGQVVDNTGFPIGGALIEANGTGEYSSATSDSLGNYTLNVSALHSYDVTASLDSLTADNSYLALFVGIHDTLTGYDFVITFGDESGGAPETGSISGMVTDSLNAPMIDVVIYTLGVNYADSTMSDSAGHFMITLPVDTYMLLAVKQGYAANKTYMFVNLSAGDALTGYDFMMK